MFNDFQDLKNELRKHTRDSSDADYSNRLDLAIQQIYMDLRQRLKSPYNTQRYELTPDVTGQATIGDEFLAADYVSFQDSTGTYPRETPLIPMTGDMHVTPGRGSIPSDQDRRPQGYRLFGSAIRVRPWTYQAADLANLKIIVEGWYRPPILKASTETSADKTLLGNIGHLLLAGAAWRLFEYKEDFDNASRWRDIYERDMGIVSSLEVTRRS